MSGREGDGSVKPMGQSSGASGNATAPALSTGQTYDWPLSKGDRHHLIAALKKLDYGYAAELAERLEATKCPACGGNGYAPYVGGDDDETGCERCNGDGFDNQNRPLLVRFEREALERLKGRPVVIVGVQPSTDGLYDLLLRDAPYLVGGEAADA